MRGEFIGVWAETWREIWLPLIEQPLAEDDEGLPEDIFCDLYRALAPALAPRPSVEDLADIIDNPVQSREAFEATTANDLAGERALVGFFEAAHDALEELGGDELSNRYFNLLSGFIDKFSLRYDLRRPCILCPTLPGVFASLVRDLRALTNQDPHLDALMKDFEDAVRDLRHDGSERRIKTCIQKQMNLLEAIGRAAPGVTGTTLGAICNQVGTWPHEKMRAARARWKGGDEEPVRVCLGLPRYSPRWDAGVQAACGGHARHGGDLHPTDRFRAIPGESSERGCDLRGIVSSMLDRFRRSRSWRAALCTHRTP